MLRCRPPTGWPTKLAIANSGGPDSTCLLFLIHRLLSEAQDPSEVSTRLVSLSIDHNLQPGSAAMADDAASFAASIGVEHHTLRIPWSTPPFPARPSTTNPHSPPFEEIAREARYHALLAGMKREGSTTIAFGHHADDQLETVLMRLMRGSWYLGSTGIRPVRRWGMGFGQGKGAVGWAGSDGLRRWIVRPLLSVTKETILATCRENNLPYVTDPSNFQPDITLRNAVRQILSRIDERDIAHSSTSHEATLLGTLPQDIGKFEKAMEFLESRVVVETLPQSLPRLTRLRLGVQELERYGEVVETQVREHLKRCVLPFRSGALLISQTELKRARNHDLRLAIVLRALRHVSPHPWGSPRAEAGRKQTSLNRIVEHMWGYHEHSRPLVAGSAVLWTPVVVRGDGSVRLRTGEKGEERAWLVTRQLPFVDHGVSVSGRSYPVEMDVTQYLTGTKLTGEPEEEHGEEVLYDNRFLLRFRPWMLPKVVRMALSGKHPVGKFVVAGEGKGLWPMVVWKTRGAVDLVLARFEHGLDVEAGNGPTVENHGNQDGTNLRKKADWVDIEWIRPAITDPL